ncbi:uncharacterized protein OCT59_017266 [Rhizophagus irregularis]|uniref:Cytochrome b561 domain-containing protein n=3 Tax=Rhizophagus irregularis TaxID=588596 RepID=A0A915ZH83_9GLOM|nr:hypothetical protein GLOIN_2v1639217 [Rhizophagus irregularis DAOM 181602=DAOM 197198]EXX76828.1 hypothetical protein RirG_029460 [Rhizophagus irregularis DAOM 197198w]POG68231.1 hypothetical protein GLOIN_2v1639217 [Rhizophagus irregularis DAOM 181602=DAOM 197198]UZO24975.1 hypothetical protein OCT59_017266 [Rhizophagus irregularis]CAB5374390.1 unnamed protein product [Rhizophagus irregularis]|eukprot:XP_025175097.1 hypothetical protein GLOIN_2v1639217 [Rhizophagus irregularis DAOM 181602=DAOM 197198]
MTFFLRKLIMEDIERNAQEEHSNKFNKDFIFYILSILGLLIYVGTNLYISYIADYKLFVWHPILMAIMILISTQGTIVLQKAVKKQEKARSLFFHKLMQIISLICLIIGFVVIYYNKSIKGSTHYKTYHAKIGLIAFIVYIIQLITGLALTFFPSLLGGISKSKKYYKHHRLTGYINLSLIWLSAITSTRANWVTKHFNQHWIWTFSIGLIIIGVIGRINFNKIKICNIKCNFSSFVNFTQYIPIYSQKNQTNQTNSDILLE